MLARPPKFLAPLVLTAALGMTPNQVRAQIVLTFEPAEFASFPLGTVVPVTFDFCSMTSWLDWQVTTIYFNNVDVTAGFAHQGWSSPNCQAFGGVDGYVYTGEFTVVPGPNNFRLVWNTSAESGEYTVHYYATYAVKVTPDFATAVRPPNTSGHGETYWIQNVGGTGATFPLTCAGTGTVTCIQPSVPSVTLQPNESTSVSVSYGVGSPGSGTLKLFASAGGVSDSGMFTITVVGPAGPPSIALRNHNGDHRDRSVCVTSGAGEAAAWQCGDLLVNHAMPGYATMGRERTLTLIYSSHVAVPRPVVAAWVTVPGGTQQPDSVFAELKVNNLALASGWYYSWGSGAARQIVLAASADTFATGIYPFSLMVRHTYGGSVYDSTKTGEVLIVNRRNSVFGAGWWVAGLEQLKTGQSGNRILWVGADGSAVIYDSIGAGAWRRAPGAFRDTLVRFDSASATWYRRTLRHRVKVTFDASGQHRRTTNRLGHSTQFYWTTQLDSIVVPPSGATATRYMLTYASGRLDKITDPAGRVLDATVASDTTLTNLTDPDGVGVSFGYTLKRLTSRANRRGYTTYVDYDSALRVTKVRAPSNVGTDTVRFAPWDQLGLIVGVVSGRRAAGDTTLSYTTFDGPRAVVADVAKFWVDRWGAPVKIVGPVADTTLLTRGDGTNPALVTRARYPNGRIAGAAYDSRGNLTESADSTYEGTGATQTVRTSFVYANSAVPDGPTEIRAPLDTLRFHYDTSLGLPDTAIAHNGHRTRFEYFTGASNRGLLNKVTELAVPVVDTTSWIKSTANLVTRLEYDGWGNDTLNVAPKGGTTLYIRDSLRRVVRVDDPGQHRTDYVYDVLNRVTAVKVFDTDTFTTRYAYSPTSTIDTVFDPRNVRRVWIYGAADQVTHMIDDVSDSARYFHGKAGLLDSVLTRSGLLIKQRYDAAGRLLATAYPGRFHDFGGVDHDATIAGDSIIRTYDVMGQLTKVTTSADTVFRTYYREGTLATERQKVANGVSNFLHELRYDVSGRRTRFHSVDGAIAQDTLFYSYGADGQLAKLKVQWVTGQPADSFLFYWDGLGRRDSLVYPNGAYIGYGYDADGHLRVVCSRHQANTNAVDYLEHRLYYTKLNADGSPLELRRHAGGGHDADCGDAPGSLVESPAFQYDGRHQVIHTGLRQYRYDKSGNRVSQRNQSGGFQDSLTYVSATNRVHHKYQSPSQVNAEFTHDADGNRSVETPITHNQWRFYYYDGVGRMTGTKWFDELILQWRGGATKCRYDPLGRRYRECGDNSPGWASFDGENVTRLEGGFTYPHWRFVHGTGLDDPLVGLRNVNGIYEKFYYLTDGRGRQLAFTDSVGNDRQGELVYTQNGGNQAGGITASHGFENQRAEAPEAPQLSFYRNRYYDQRTGRFTQEDVNGIAGGVNLYQFTGNNPATYTDPFGLCVPWPQCALIGAAAGARVGTVVGAGIGTVVGTPGPGTLAGAGIGRAVGAIGAFVVLTGSAIALAVAAAADEPDDRTADEIISQDKKGSIRREFPGQMLGKTLAEIARIARERNSPDRDAAKKAKKLLKEKRFDKES